MHVSYIYINRIYFVNIQVILIFFSLLYCHSEKIVLIYIRKYFTKAGKDMKKSVMKEYAKLVVKIGANVQKGQPVIIHSSIETGEFTKYVVEAAYKAGAKSVKVKWSSIEIDKLDYRYQTVKTMTDIPEYRIKELEHQVQTLPAVIHILSEDPDGLNGVNQSKLTEVRRKNGPVIMKYREQMDNKHQWTIVGVPGEKWAKKVFPNDKKSVAMRKLWDAILDVTRVNGDAIENWNAHNASLSDKLQKLNSMKIKTLSYKSANGTDFSVGLNENIIFDAGMAKTLSGVTYNPNMPTEECFTSPDKTTANGIVMATKPLSVMGKLVSDFGFRFENGKVVEVISNKEEEKTLLEKFISLDEGASMLGEVALVPYDSPINKTGILFYNTLYDENACCHLALGRAFNECIKDYDKMTEEEIKAFGLNNSMVHEDFMIGSEDLSIVAETYDGKTVQIFKDGTWAF